MMYDKPKWMTDSDNSRCSAGYKMENPASKVITPFFRNPFLKVFPQYWDLASKINVLPI